MQLTRFRIDSARLSQSARPFGDGMRRSSTPYRTTSSAMRLTCCGRRAGCWCSRAAATTSTRTTSAWASCAGGGDFVVLRASGEDDYNDYIYGLCHCDSVETHRLRRARGGVRSVRDRHDPQRRGALHRRRRPVATTSASGRARRSRTRSTSSRPSRRRSAARARAWRSWASSSIPRWARTA